MKLRKLQKKMNQKGFTLIELIIVIAILGILAALAIPRFFGFTENAKEAADEEYCEVVANAALIYYAKEDVMPTFGALTADDLIVESDIVSELYGGASAPSTPNGYTFAEAAGIMTVTIDTDGTDIVCTK